MPHVEHALEDPVVEAGLSQLVAVEDRPYPLPAFLEEREQGVVRLLRAHPVPTRGGPGGVTARGARRVTPPAAQCVHDPRRAVHAEATLTRTHPEPQDAAEVAEVVGPSAAHRLLELPARDQLALADELVVEQLLLAPGEPLAQHVVRAVLRSRQALRRRGARPLVAEVAADRVDGLLRHQPERRELAAGDRDEAADAVPLG